MDISLAKAPIGVNLTVTDIGGEEFAERVARFGLYVGASLMRLEESVTVGPVKVRGNRGEAILSGWLAGQVVIHLDDDRRVPLLECPRSESGHVEGITGHGVIEESLRVLGIVEGDRVAFVRKVPPMAYKAAIDGGGSVSLNEDLASHLVGEGPDGLDGPVQFSLTGVGEPFTVRRVLGGGGAAKALASMGIEPGTRLSLQSVSVSHALNYSGSHPLVCAMKNGMRLYFHQKGATRIMVSPS